MPCLVQVSGATPKGDGIHDGFKEDYHIKPAILQQRSGGFALPGFTS